jgi:tetratricopeptide (TPR) repeat protein
LAYNNRGAVYPNKGNYDRAIADYNQAIKLKSKADYASYYHRVIAYRKKGNKNKAIADFKKIIELTKEPKIRQYAEK